MHLLRCKLLFYIYIINFHFARIKGRVKTVAQAINPVNVALSPHCHRQRKEDAYAHLQSVGHF